ncbi:MAG: T9SS type A sorting domain-containing protein [Bacteroidota bacterium]|nr:T9SS type A sorting domain-containing protein [Bacteroidota bacterium]
MKKILQLTAAVALTFATVEGKAQLADGSIAPDFTVTDINGTSHNLYTYLNAGKTVYIDVSATWCGPCWGFHGTNALEDLWVNHGPIGGTNVIAGTTNDVIVLFVEGDNTTNSADLNGTGTSTQGDWVTGVSHPIVDETGAAVTNFNNAYNIGYFPTIYMICPNRIITEVGQQSATALYAAKSSCPAPASVALDPALLTYKGTELTCGNVNMIVQMQNNGTGALTSATITAMDGATPVGTVNWTGSLATYEVADVTIGSTTISATTNLTFSITSSDGNPSNNTITKTINYSTLQANSTAVTVKISTDRYGSETTWKLRNSAGTVVSSGGPYSNASSAGAYPQTPVNVTLPAGCYGFELYDSYGDGFTGAYGNGSAEITAASASVFIINSFTGTEDGEAFKTVVVGVEENEMVNNVNVYPNPVTNNATVNFELAQSNEVSIAVVNAIGQLVVSENLGTLAPGSQVYSLDATSLNNGLYFLNITVGNHTITKKVSISK